jgi:hypothetical protein
MQWEQWPRCFSVGGGVGRRGGGAYAVLLGVLEELVVLAGDFVGGELGAAGFARFAAAAIVGGDAALEDF